MRLLLAILLPPVCFILIGKPFAALFSLVLMLTMFGWPVCSLWAVYSLGQWKTDRKLAEINRREW